RDFHAIPDFDFAVLRDAARKFHLVQLAVAAYRQLQGLGQRIDAGDAHAVQAAGYLVGVLVELAAGMQLGHHDFGSAALGLVLVIPFDVNWNAAAIVGDRNGIVGMDGDVNFSAVASQRFVDGVVQHLENKVMQTGAVGGVA